MPLDLSPCDVGVPSCQPTFDLTKKQFLPNKNIPPIREMVKTKQNKSLDPLTDVFKNRMEGFLIKKRLWFSSQSSHSSQSSALAMKKGTISREGVMEHPYDSTLDAVTQWWSKVSLSFSGRKENFEAEDDKFSFIFELDETNTTATANATAVAVAVVDRGLDHPRTAFGTHHTVPFQYPQRATTAVEHEAIIRNEQAIYQQYYTKPIPSDYLSLSHSPNFEDELNHFCQQQNRYYRPRNWLGWGIPCFPACKKS